MYHTKNVCKNLQLIFKYFCVLFYFKDKDVKISDDPNLLSFQVMRLGIFSQEQVSELLGIESTNLRLQYELQYWNKIVSNVKEL